MAEATPQPHHSIRCASLPPQAPKFFFPDMSLRDLSTNYFHSFYLLYFPLIERSSDSSYHTQQHHYRLPRSLANRYE